MDQTKHYTRKVQVNASHENTPLSPSLCFINPEIQFRPENGRGKINVFERKSQNRVK